MYGTFLIWQVSVCSSPSWEDLPKLGNFFSNYDGVLTWNGMKVKEPLSTAHHVISM